MRLCSSSSSQSTTHSPVSTRHRLLAARKSDDRCARCACFATAPSEDKVELREEACVPVALRSEPDPDTKGSLPLRLPDREDRKGSARFPGARRAPGLHAHAAAVQARLSSQRQAQCSTGKKPLKGGQLRPSLAATPGTGAG